MIAGAEAAVSIQPWLGRDVLVKARLPKSYRHPILDAQIRAERTRDEANLLLLARKAGVRVPVVYDADRNDCTLKMEQIHGPALRDVLETDSVDDAATRFRALGPMIARLHAAGVTHGDLTTSNILVEDAGLVIIDFGLGQITMEGEPRAVDLHLMEEALEATHPEAATLMDAFLASYQAEMPGGADVMRRLEGVRARGRYRGAT